MGSSISQSAGNARPATQESSAETHPELRPALTKSFEAIAGREFSRTLLLAVGLPVLLLSATAVVLWWASNQLASADRLAQHTSQVIAQSFETLKLALDMETGVRGYVNTGQQEFLQPYRDAGPQIAPALNRLRELVRDSADEAQIVDRISVTLDQWGRLSAQTVQAASQLSPQQRLRDTVRGKQLMDRTRDDFATLVQLEQMKREGALQSSRSAGRLTSRLAIFLTLAVAAIIALISWYQLTTVVRSYRHALSQSEKLTRELAAREAHFRQLTEAIPQMVWAASPEGEPQYYNHRWAVYTGSDPLSRGSWLRWVSPQDQEKAEREWSEAVAHGTEFALELRLRNAAGQYRWHLLQARPLRDEKGGVVRWLGTFTDVDDQKRFEEALLRLAAIVQSSDDAIYSKDLDGRITSWNRGAERMFGYSEQEIVGKPATTLSPPDRLPEMEEMLATIARGQSIEHVETIRLRKDGRPIEVSLAISPIRVSSGEIIGGSTIARDVTERNRANEALRKTEKLAETGRLAGTIAHEINNPLEAITHLLYLIERNPTLDDKGKEYAQVATQEVSRIGHIAKQALGFYRETAEPVQVSLADLIKSVVALYTSGAQNKNVTLEAQIESTATVSAFPGEMRQVFSNLIVNAVDAVPRGGTVKVRVKHSREWKSNALGMRVLVSDNGPGIPPQVRSRIFEPFFTTKGERGTGVGLWVSEGVIQKHRGSIRLKTSTGAVHGTTFSVFVPYG